VYENGLHNYYSQNYLITPSQNKCLTDLETDKPAHAMVVVCVVALTSGDDSRAS